MIIVDREVYLGRDGYWDTWGNIGLYEIMWYMSDTYTLLIVQHQHIQFDL